MNVLRSIRRGSAVAFTCGWISSIVVAATAALAESAETTNKALAVEMLCLAAAVTATLVYVIATLTAHIDDTQWAVGYSDKFRHAGSTEPNDHGKG